MKVAKCMTVRADQLQTALVTLQISETQRLYHNSFDFKHDIPLLT
jgi:hypothetical protein